jgi:prepilin-type processing-associated H-X9-DG protein
MELLVVISIIALLIGILLPALGAARKTGRQVSCQSQLRQIGIAIETYAVDHHEVIPAAYWRGDQRNHYTWDDAIRDRLGSPLDRASLMSNGISHALGSPMFICPEDPTRDDVGYDPLAPRSYVAIYGGLTNSGFFSAGPRIARGPATLIGVSSNAEDQWFRKGSGFLPDEAGTAYLTEHVPVDPSAGSPVPTPTTVINNRQGQALPVTTGFSSAYHDRVTRHAGKASDQPLHGGPEAWRYNYLFLDGHVAIDDPRETTGDVPWDENNLPEGRWTRAADD